MIHESDAPILIDLSDPHFGSSRALMPPGFRDSEDKGHTPNKYQEWLWAYWLDFGQWLDWVCGKDRRVLLLNGDIIEGVHHGTTELVTNDPVDHAKMAVEVLAPIVEKADAVYLVRGTEVHTRNAEYAIGYHLGAKKCRVTGQYAHDKLWLRQMGVLSTARHHIGTTGRQALEATQLSIQLAEEQMQAARVGNPIPRILYSAHRHVYGLYSDGDAMCVVTPSWQYLTRHAHKVVPASKSKFGGVVMDWRRVGEGSLPEVRARLYRHRITGDPAHAAYSQAEIEAKAPARNRGHQPAAKRRPRRAR